MVGIYHPIIEPMVLETLNAFPRGRDWVGITQVLSCHSDTPQGVGGFQRNN